jgi:formylglycine-generating enzyme required for sulfatase activity
MRQRLILFCIILLALFALVPAQSVRAQEPAADGGRRILLPVVATPAIFANPWPADNAQRQSLNAFLTWQVIHPDWLDANFSVYLTADDSTPDTLLAVGLRKASYDPYTFAENTLYYWQIVAEKPDGRRAASPVWHFQTDYFPFPPELGSMVYVPEGEFMMGCDPLHAGFDCFGEQLPLHAVWLSAFWLDKYEVTNLEYRTCVAAGVCDNPRRGSLEGEAYFDQPQYDFFPVVFVSHWDAEDYCGWVGKRLLTEAEWEKAARGSIDTRPWPWGDEPWNCTNMNRCRESDEWFTVAVDNMHPGQSPYGALNMAGNTAEWLQDWYFPDYYKESPYINPVNTTEWNPQWGWKYYSIRGGSFHDNWYYSRTNHRKFGHWGEEPGDDKPLYRSFRTGIRCASSSAP